MRAYFRLLPGVGISLPWFLIPFGLVLWAAGLMVVIALWLLVLPFRLIFHF